jgi:phosphoglycerol transferase MdoB-like AlkP superfamily enzyme
MNLSNQVAVKKFLPVAVLYLIGLAINLLTRFILFFVSFHQLDFSFKNVIGIFLIGAFYDLCFLSFVSIPIVLFIWLSNDTVYKKPWRYVVMTIFSIAIIVSFIHNPIPKEYDEKLPRVLIGVLFTMVAIYFFLLKSSESFRARWRIGFLNVLFFIIIFLFVFNIVSEYTFWDEYGTRYNFIAVDYLIYTNEVIGNIKESYPVGWILTGVLVVTILIYFLIKKYLISFAYTPFSFINRTGVAFVLLLLPAFVYLFVNNGYRKFSTNDYVNELAGNGLYEFGTAFFNNDLDFYKFYQTLPDAEALAEVKRQILERSPSDSFVNSHAFSIERMVSYPGEEKKMNVVLISIESMSASFMRSFGNQQNITPYLDSLSQHSLFFAHCYATGTRTVRGLEVLSLSIPPIPGQSIVRRTNNDSLFSIASVLRQKGYITQFLYGGYSSFDNMGPYFKANGYEVVDRSALQPSAIHYANIWGVADEDMYTLALQKFDENFKTGKPFFSQIMTVSNHRPYTYPENRIDIPPSEQRREGAVKYTDYAINDFIKKASLKPWFANTIFVIVADHCASAAGKQALPVNGYHIPLIIFSPAHIQPKVVENMISQMDIAPTILGLLNVSYRSKFFGQDVLRMPQGKDRAFISTYSGLGYVRDSQLVVQLPPKKVEQLRPNFTTGESKVVKGNDSLYRQAVSYYQVAEKIFKSGGYKEIKSIK